MKNNATEYAELTYIRRVVKKKTASEMAGVIEKSTETYLRSERGEREFTLTEAMRLAIELNMPIEVVFPKIFALNVATGATM